MSLQLSIVILGFLGLQNLVNFLYFWIQGISFDGELVFDAYKFFFKTILSYFLLSDELFELLVELLSYTQLVPRYFVLYFNLNTSKLGF
jgi:hypothetical protein